MERVLHKFTPTQQHYLLFQLSMASLFSTTCASLSYGGRGPVASKPPRRMVGVRAEAINPDIRKTEEKVVDSVLLPEISKPVTAYCRFHSFHPTYINFI